MRLKRTCLVLSLLISAGVLQPAIAQRGASPDELASRSHRKLTLPGSGSSDFQQQLAQLRQLQAMWQNSQAGENDSAQGLSTFEKTLAENMMRQALKGGDAPKLNDLPPGLVSKVMSNQAARRDIQELLQKFRQDGLMPQGNAQGGGPSLPGRQPSGTANSNNSARVLREPDRNRQTGSQTTQGQPAGGQTGADQPPGFSSSPTGTNPGARPRQNSGDGDASTGRPGQAANRPGQNSQAGPASRFPGIGDDNRNGGVPSAQGDNTTAPNPLDRQPGESAADHARRMGDYLDEKLREKQRQPDSGSGSNNGVRRGPTGSQSSQQGTGGTPPVSMSDLLNEFGGLAEQQPGTSAGRNGTSSSGRSSGGRQNQQGTRTSPRSQPPQQGGRSTNGDSAGPAASSSVDTSSLQEAAKQTLKSKGLKAAIHQVMNSARRDIRDSNGRSTDGAGGMSEGVRTALVDALSGISDDVVRIAQDARSRRSGSPARPSNRAGNSGRSESRSSSNSSWIGQIRDSINNSGGSTPPAAGSGGMSPPDLSAGGGSLLSLLLIVAVVGGIVWWLMKTGQLTAQASGPRLTAAHIGAIRSRQDVVNAFHLIALDPRHGAEPWWHHEQVRQDLTTRLPSRESSLADLTEVYERARYLPDDVELDETQLETARDAIERCRP